MPGEHLSKADAIKRLDGLSPLSLEMLLHVLPRFENSDDKKYFIAGQNGIIDELLSSQLIALWEADTFDKLAYADRQMY